jgi:hypothetical protein
MLLTSKLLGEWGVPSAHRINIIIIITAYIYAHVLRYYLGNGCSSE